jgi:hypothetical protein
MSSSVEHTNKMPSIVSIIHIYISVGMETGHGRHMSRLPTCFDVRTDDSLGRRYADVQCISSAWSRLNSKLKHMSLVIFFGIHQLITYTSGSLSYTLVIIVVNLN